MSKKLEDLSKLSISEIIEKYQEMEAMASYYEGKVKRIENRKANRLKVVKPKTKNEIQEFRKERESLNFPNNPLSQPEPCEETKIKLFGNQDIKSV